jgi:hypothetical protein
MPMNISISLNLTLRSVHSHRTQEIGTQLKQFFENRLLTESLSMIQAGDTFRFVDLDLCVSKRTWNLLDQSTYLEVDLTQI